MLCFKELCCAVLCAVMYCVLFVLLRVQCWYHAVHGMMYRQPQTENITLTHCEIQTPFLTSALFYAIFSSLCRLKAAGCNVVAVGMGELPQAREFLETLDLPKEFKFFTDPTGNIFFISHIFFHLFFFSIVISYFILIFYSHILFSYFILYCCCVFFYI
jgi:hypothetical protein